MTAIVGILNIRGAAIAADSAVTMNRNSNRKIANSANKMLRLSSAQPVSVMICGSASFLWTPWDIIIRRYRQKRGHIDMPTVQACVDDFFSYMISEKSFFPDAFERNFLQYSINNYFQSLKEDIPLAIINDDGKVTNLKSIIHAFKTEIKKSITSMTRLGKCPMFEDYTLEQFTERTSSLIDDYIDEQTSGNFVAYPIEVFQAIRKELVEGLFCYVTTRSEHEGATLVFTGFGTEEDYPTLISANVNEGFDRRVCYHIKDEDIVHVSPEKPVAICPFAQRDIMNALLTGVNPGFYGAVHHYSFQMFTEFERLLDEKVCGEEIDDDFFHILEQVKYNDLYGRFKSYGNKLLDSTREQWLKTLHDYDLQDLAQLAENLIAMTSLERHMTFSEEGVGGPIDLAIITKNNGFTWLSRKSWYHHVDVGGRYGKFGV